MITIQELKRIEQSKVDALLNECKVFFAFSNEQFTENKTELKEGEKYVSIGAGGYMPKGYVDTYLNGMKAIKKNHTKAVKAIKDPSQIEAHILYTLNNYECFYTGNIEDAVNELQGMYTIEQIRDVFYNNRQKHA